MKKTLIFLAAVFSLAVIMPFISIKTAKAIEITAQSSNSNNISATIDPVPASGQVLTSSTSGEQESSVQAALIVSSGNQLISEDEPVILPTNPFYFTKEFARGVRMFFTFGRLNKAAYELQVADEKARELKQVENLAPENSKGIEKAVDNYSQNIDRLKTRLESLGETSANPNISALLDSLATRAIDHDALFEELKNKNSAIREKMEMAQENIDTAVSEASMKFDNSERLKERLQKAVSSQSDEKNTQEQSGIMRIIDKIEKNPVDSKDFTKLKMEADSALNDDARKEESGSLRSESAD